MPKTGQPDANDAQLLLAIYGSQSANNLSEVMGYIWSNDFPADFKTFREMHERGSNSSEEQSLYRALGYFETVGTLHRNNLISEDLLFDWMAVDLVWSRVKGFVLGVRKEIGSPRMFENFEYMARRNANWTPARSRPAAKAKHAAAKKGAPAGKRTAAATRTRPAAAKRAPAAKRTAARGRATARRTPAARKRA